MQPRIMQKIQSQRGASLSMALMLFLICTVVSSIVLAAGTAVAGRLSQLREADASYYNVSSAARFVWDELKGGDDNNGLVVNVTRTCNAQKNADGEWDGWLMRIDSVLDTSADAKSISSSNATLFQLATYDLIMDKESIGGIRKLKFSDNRTPDEDDIASRFDTSGSVPSPLEVVFAEGEYDPFTFSVEGLKPVTITVYKHEDQTFEFVFTENDGDADSYVCTITALVETNGGDLLPPSSDGTVFEGGVTTVRWKPIDMMVGEP